MGRRSTKADLEQLVSVQLENEIQILKSAGWGDKRIVVVLKGRRNVLIECSSKIK